LLLCPLARTTAAPGQTRRLALKISSVSGLFRVIDVMLPFAHDH
jgi:hypothetical protein